MKAIDIRNKYLNFFEKHGHKIIPSAPLIPENDPSVLFNVAGMQPLVPYLLGQKHPEGKRIADFQKCVRTIDIDEVGDSRHCTFFEMLGNWSLGDYFKEESIKMSFEFLTKELEIPVEKLSVTCFAGNNDVKKDEVSALCWQKAGIPKDRIYFLKDNWWIAGETGPCGSDTEIFYDTGKPKCSEKCNPDCDCGKYVEIWNNVFMEFFKNEDGSLSPLNQKNVDTGLGLERVNMVLQGKETVYETEIFLPVMKELEKMQNKDFIQSRRIVAEHLRSSIMIIADGARPSNVDRGYVLRRLIRRMIRHLKKLEIDLNKINDLVKLNINTLKELYPELKEKEDIIISVLIEEKNKFEKTLEKGEKEFVKQISKAKEKNQNVLSGSVVFRLYDTYGFPPELTSELAKENNFDVDLEEFNKLFKVHQEKSRAGFEQKFKGGLAEQNDITIAYHTATHLLNAALKQILGKDTHQMGSNITVDRMRFDFNCDHKLTEEEKKKIEELVNKWINDKLEVKHEEMKKDEAINSGAECMFIEKYPDIVTVYTIGDISKELCGGPHVKNTFELGVFKIKKEEASSSGIRRIKAVLIRE